MLMLPVMSARFLHHGNLNIEIMPQPSNCRLIWLALHRKTINPINVIIPYICCCSCYTFPTDTNTATSFSKLLLQLRLRLRLSCCYRLNFIIDASPLITHSVRFYTWFISTIRHQKRNIWDSPFPFQPIRASRFQQLDAIEKQTDF